MHCTEKQLLHEKKSIQIDIILTANKTNSVNWKCFEYFVVCSTYYVPLQKQNSCSYCLRELSRAILIAMIWELLSVENDIFGMSRLHSICI